MDLTSLHHGCQNLAMPHFGVSADILGLPLNSQRKHGNNCQGNRKQNGRRQKEEGGGEEKEMVGRHHGIMGEKC